MKNGIDFEYEYSDLNLFQTRVKVLTGEYKGLVLEYGPSSLVQWEGKNTFTFDYTLYEVPAPFVGPELRKEPKFNEFLAYLLVDVIDARNNDAYEKMKIDEAATSVGKTYSNIPIDRKYYKQKGQHKWR